MSKRVKKEEQSHKTYHFKNKDKCIAIQVLVERPYQIKSSPRVRWGGHVVGPGVKTGHVSMFVQLLTA